MTGALAFGVVEAALAALVVELFVSLWQLRRIRKAQVEQGLQLAALTGLMDGRTTKLAQDLAQVVDLLLDEETQP